jgi:hypothetical protein
MKKILTLALGLSMVTLGAFSQSAKTSATGTIKAIFYVDMSKATMDVAPNAAFDPAIDKVDVAGTFNSWGGTTTLCSRVKTSSIYTFHLDTLTAGSVLKFKFRINGSWTNSEFQNGGPDRVFTVQAPSENKNVYNTAYDDTNAVLTAVHSITNDVKSFVSYPNPAAHEVNFSYSVENAADVAIHLYNVMGAEVSATPVARQAPGFHFETLDVNKVENGLYFYVLTVNGTEHLSGKIQILK